MAGYMGGSSSIGQAGRTLACPRGSGCAVRTKSPRAWALPLPLVPHQALASPAQVLLVSSVAPCCMDHPAHPTTPGHDAWGDPGAGSHSSRAHRA